MKQLQTLLNKLPHWVFVGIALLAGAFVQNLRDQPDFLSAITSWNTAHLVADLKMAGAFAMTAVIGWLRTDPWTAGANVPVPVVPTVPKLSMLLPLLALLALHQTACITSSPTVPVTPANAAQISACQATASLHNGVVIGDIVVGGSAAGLGTIAALPSAAGSARDGLVIATAAAAGIATIGGGVAALTSVNFSNSHCTDVVAPLPMKPGPQARLLPRLSELDETTVTVEGVSR